MRWNEFAKQNIHVVLSEAQHHNTVIVDKNTNPREVLDHCKQYLQAVQKSGEYLYRGINSSNTTGATHGVDSATNGSVEGGLFPRVYEVVVDEYVQSISKSSRTSIYATSDYDVASYYGPPHLLIPTDGFTALWAANSSDLHTDHNLFPGYSEDGYLDSKKYYLPPHVNATAWLDQIDLETSMDAAAYGMKPAKFAEVTAETNWFLEPDINKHIAAGLVKPPKWERTRKHIMKELKTQYDWVEGKLFRAMSSGHEVMMEAETFFLVPPELVESWQQAIQDQLHAVEPEANDPMDDWVHEMRKACQAHFPPASFPGVHGRTWKADKLEVKLQREKNGNIFYHAGQEWKTDEFRLKIHSYGYADSVEDVAANKTFDKLKWGLFFSWQKSYNFQYTPQNASPMEGWNSVAKHIRMDPSMFYGDGYADPFGKEGRANLERYEQDYQSKKQQYEAGENK